MKPYEHLSQSELEELKRVFFTQSFEILEELQDAMLKLEANPADKENLKAIQRYFHTLKGDSNSLGLTAVGGLCHRVEDILTHLRDHEKPIDSDTVGLLLNGVDTIDYLLRLHEADGSQFPLEGQDNPLIGELTQRIDAYLENHQDYALAARPAEAGPSAPTEYQRLLMENARARGLKLYQAKLGFHPLCADKGVGAYMVGQKINQWGEIIGTNPDLEGEEIERAQGFTVLLAARLTREEIRAKIFISGITGELHIEDYAGPAPLPAPLAVSPPQKKGLPEKKGEHSLAPSQRGLMRIEASKVDKIMNLVGELIIGRSIIDQITKDLAEKRSPEDLEARLSAVNAYLERNISDLQRGVMKMRMVPINHAFRKFPKMVRDLAAEKGKRVLLQVHGQETELDKSIVDAIGEPLAHIIRNCIDHGIEDPSQRRAGSKAEEGVITLRAYQEAAQIVIETADDGRGIDRERLRQKAVEKGFFSAEEAAKLTEAEVLNLIFYSGLSASRAVSETSGRGIGMDAVKSVLQNLKGSIEVESTPGQGTRFRLRLPLTLAVIKALLFEVGDKLYALPLAVIAEVTRVLRENLTTIEGRKVLKLREQVVSIIDLGEMFKISASGQKRKFVLIMGLGKSKVGLLVDRLWGQQELVVKALDGQYTPSGLVAGASILGSGRVVLILDAFALWRQAVARERQRMTTV